MNHLFIHLNNLGGIAAVLQPFSSEKTHLKCSRQGCDIYWISLIVENVCPEHALFSYTLKICQIIKQSLPYINGKQRGK